MRVTDLNLVALDFETTGLVAGYPDEPWQIGLVLVRGGRMDADCQYSSLLRVGPRPFNRFAPGRHAELRDQLAVAPPLAQLWPLLRQWLVDRPLVAHNAATERRITRTAFPLHTFGPWIDTLKLARVAYPQHPTHKLEDLVNDLDLAGRVASACPDRESHDALYDAIACGVLLEHLLGLPGWQHVTLHNLVNASPRHFHRRQAQRRHREDSTQTSS